MTAEEVTTEEAVNGVSSAISGIRNIAEVFRNIFDAFDRMAGWFVELGLTETQAWASIIVLIVALFVISAKYVTRFAIVLIIIVVLFILASIFGVI